VYGTPVGYKINNFVIQPLSTLTQLLSEYV